MKELYRAKFFFKMLTMKMLLEAEEASEKKVSEKTNHEFKQFNSA